MGGLQRRWSARGPFFSQAMPQGAELPGYRIGRVLGAGGFAITYLAEHTAIRNRVALKEFLPSGIALRAPDGTVRPVSPSKAEDFAWGLERFRDEARTLGRLRHPNIVPVLNFIEANRTAYMVMEFVDGETLAERLDRVGLLEADNLEPLLPGLFSGVEAVHAAGFLHRDIKPANVMLRADGTPVLIDFGAARQALQAHTRSLTAILSDGYSPYEQYQRGGDQGAWTDIYALGATLYTCVTGEKPAEAARRIGARFRGRPDPLVPARQLAEGRYPAPLLAAIDAALAPVETERPQSVAELRALAGIAAEGRAVSSSEPSATSSSPPASVSANEAKASSASGADTLIVAAGPSLRSPARGPRGWPWRGPAGRYALAASALVVIAAAGLASRLVRDVQAPEPPAATGEVSAVPSPSADRAPIQPADEADRAAKAAALEDLAAGLAAKDGAAFDKALLLLARAIESGKLAPPEQARARLGRSAAWIGKSDYARATAEADEAVRADPASDLARRERGRLAVYRRDWDAAMADLDAAVRLGPGEAENYAWRALVFYHRGDLGPALADYDEALRLRPDYAQARFGRGLAWLKSGERARAVDDFREVARAAAGADRDRARRMLESMGEAE